MLLFLLMMTVQVSAVLTTVTLVQLQSTVVTSQLVQMMPQVSVAVRIPTVLAIKSQSTAAQSEHT